MSSIPHPSIILLKYMSTEGIYLISLSWLQHRGVPIMNTKTIMNVLIAILLVHLDLHQ